MNCDEAREIIKAGNWQRKIYRHKQIEYVIYGKSYVAPAEGLEANLDMLKEKQDDFYIGVRAINPTCMDKN